MEKGAARHDDNVGPAQEMTFQIAQCLAVMHKRKEEPEPDRFAQGPEGPSKDSNRIETAPGRRSI